VLCVSNSRPPTKWTHQSLNVLIVY
jgi:hypothetical protein